MTDARCFHHGLFNPCLTYHFLARPLEDGVVRPRQPVSFLFIEKVVLHARSYFTCQCCHVAVKSAEPCGFEARPLALSFRYESQCHWFLSSSSNACRNNEDVARLSSMVYRDYCFSKFSSSCFHCRPLPSQRITTSHSSVFAGMRDTEIFTSGIAVLINRPSCIAENAYMT